MPAKYNWITGPYSGDWLKSQGRRFLDFLNKPLLPESKPPPTASTNPLEKFFRGAGDVSYNILRSLSAPKDVARETLMTAFPGTRIPGLLSYAGESAYNKDPLGFGLSAAGAGGLAAARRIGKAKTRTPITAVNEPIVPQKNKYWRGLKQEGNTIIEVGKITAKDGKIRTRKLAGSTIWKGLKTKQYKPEMLSDDMRRKAYNYYNKHVAPKTTGYVRKKLDDVSTLREQQLTALKEGLSYKPGAYAEAIPKFGGKFGKVFKTAFEDFANADRQAQRTGDQELKKQIRKAFNEYMVEKGYKDKGGKFLRDDIRQVMSNYYDRGRSWSLFRNIGAPISQTSKNLILSSGLAGTGVNWFGSGMLARSFMDSASRGFKGEFFHSARMIVNPAEGARVLKDNVNQIPRLVRAGLDFSAADNLDPEMARLAGKTLVGVDLTARNAPDKALKYTLGKLDKWFGEPLFGRIIPAMKVQSALGHEALNLKRGMKPRQALKEAVRTANGLYSGKQLEIDRKGR